jgi:hypothetical protein
MKGYHGMVRAKTLAAMLPMVLTLPNRSLQDYDPTIPIASEPLPRRPVLVTAETPTVPSL